jgi:hypothetical protein
VPVCVCVRACARGGRREEGNGGTEKHRSQHRRYFNCRALASHVGEKGAEPGVGEKGADKIIETKHKLGTIERLGMKERKG